jgi:hypothetical protein
LRKTGNNYAINNGATVQRCNGATVCGMTIGIQVGVRARGGESETEESYVVNRIIGLHNCKTINTALA